MLKINIKRFVADQNCIDDTSSTTKSVNLKMLDMYLYTFIIGQTSCNMLSIVNKLTLQNKLCDQLG